MNYLIDKLVIIMISLALYIPYTNSKYMIVPILIVIILSAVLSCMEDQRKTLGIFLLYLLVCFIKQDFLFFIPLICYDVVLLKKKWIWALSFIPLIADFNHTPITSKCLIAAVIINGFILKYRTVSIHNTERNYYKLRDNANEISMKLEKQNKELLEKQNYEVNLATLKERNRIARDIHDNVGHLLSRSILQIGALLAIKKDDATKENLKLIKDTLSEAMDSIRNSIHDMHEESIDLKYEIQKLIDNFKFCSVKFEYDAEANIDKDIKYCFISVTKEALSNTLKHSNATNILVTIREHPALFQLVIHDNGTQSRLGSGNGIGLKNISDRVTTLRGNINISTEKGFRIFISIPKTKV